MHRQPLNSRSARTRRALKSVFAKLVQSRGFEDLEVTDITTVVGISRSTFYAHYSGINALLSDSITGPFEVLADTIRPEFVESRLVELLDHFWENRRFARGILVGPARRKTAHVLILLVEHRLKYDERRQRSPMILPPRLLAVQLAEILLAPVTSWLLGEARCSSRTLAVGLRRVSIAAVAAMSG